MPGSNGLWKTCPLHQFVNIRSLEMLHTILTLGAGTVPVPPQYTLVLGATAVQLHLSASLHS